MIKVLIVDDSAFNRKTIAEMLKASGEIEVVGTAYDGEDAIRYLSKVIPDVITLDLEMPKMDGFTFLRWLMNYHPIPVIVVSSKEADENVFKAMELGAIDFIPKPSSYPSLRLKEIQHLLIEKVFAAKYAKIIKQPSYVSKPAAAQIEKKVCEVPTDFIVVIGASTGGPQAIQYILKNLEPHFIFPIVIGQHMPITFTSLFAERLNKTTHMIVKEAEEGEEIKSNHAYICPGGRHTIIEKRGKSSIFLFRKKEDHDKYIPSVNALFESAANVYAERVVAAILTGMGDDGKLGVLKIKEKGGRVIAESPDSAVVFGMPKEAIKTGMTDYIFNLQKIPSFLSKLMTNFRES